jgi:hypothetical protein
LRATESMLSSSFGLSVETAEDNVWGMFPLLRTPAPELKLIRPQKYVFKGVIIGPNSR